MAHTVFHHDRLLDLHHTNCIVSKQNDGVAQLLALSREDWETLNNADRHDKLVTHQGLAVTNMRKLQIAVINYEANLLNKAIDGIGKGPLSRAEKSILLWRCVDAQDAATAAIRRLSEAYMRDMERLDKENEDLQETLNAQLLAGIGPRPKECLNSEAESVSEHPPPVTLHPQISRLLAHHFNV